MEKNVDPKQRSAKKFVQEFKKLNPSETLSSSESSEVDTKLDLITAYLDMGDQEGARELLQEVLKEGGPSQREKTLRLLKQLEQAKKRANSKRIPRTPKMKKSQPTPDTQAPAQASSILTATRAEAEAEKDFLDRGKLTQALYRLLTEREDDHPFAIGLFGHWGAGKSSQINFLQNELKQTDQPEVLVAEFNAWQNEKGTNLAAMLAQAVVDRLTADMGAWERLRLAVRLAVRRHSPVKKAIEKDWRSLSTWLSWAWVLLPPIGSLFILGLLLWWMPTPDTLFAPFFKVLAGVVATLASAYHFMRSHLTEWFKHLNKETTLSLFSLPDYSTHRGLILDIHRTLHDLCDLCLKGSPSKEGTYLLLVVDDLDRCGVDTVKDVLDAVRLVASIPRVVTLVAIDERMAFAAVEKHYHQFGHAGRSPALVARDYLAKVLQVSVTLPEVDPSRIGSYVEKKIFFDIGQPSVGQTAGATVPPTEPVIEPATKQAPPPQSSLPEEKELFKELAQAYSFSNPRLLWRLYMAWKLLKSLTLSTTYTLADVETLMRLLFWREWLRQWGNEQRKAYSDWMSDASGQTRPQGMPPAIYDAVYLRLRPNQEKIMPLIGVVDAVLLPASPSEV